MVRRTFGQVKSSLASVAGATGMPVSDPLVLQYVNQAIQELANEGDWPGVVDRWHFRFNEATAHIALPSFLERLISVTVDDVPLEIRSPWYEFVQFGPGIQREADQDRTNRRAWVDVVMDRGEYPAQYRLPDTEGPYSLCLTPQVVESSTAQANLQGTNEDGNFIRTLTEGTNGSEGDWYNGENVLLSDGTAGTTRCTTAEFATLSSVIKPVTNGPVTLTADNGVDTPLTLSTYQFDEINPSYRHYFIPHLYRPDTTNYAHRVILARCRRRFVEITEDNDPLMISNVLALQEMMIAQHYRRVPDIDQYLAHKQTAIDILRKESLAYMGRSRTPSLTFSRGWPVGAMPHYR